MEDACACAICHDLFIDCVETPCCTVGYCRECLSSYINKMKKGCPICKKVVNVKDLKKNVLAQRIADAFPMGTCEHPGCKAKLNWGNVRSHDGVCAYKPVKCTWNDKCKILQGEKSKHEDWQCPYRNITDAEEAFRTECLAHPKEPLALYCRTERKYLCVTCWVEHKDDSHDIVPLSLLHGIVNVGAIQHVVFAPSPPPTAALPVSLVARPRREFACSSEAVRTQATELARLADLFA